MRKVEFKMKLRDQLELLLNSLVLIVALIWIFRDILLISQYSNEIVYTFIFFLFLSKIINVRFDMGIFGFISSLLSSIGSFSISLCIAFFLGGFLGLEKQFTSYTVSLLVAGIIAYLASWSFGTLVSKRRITLGKKLTSFYVENNQIASGIEIGADELNGIPILYGNKISGAVLFNNFDLNINTTLGNVRVPIKPPALVLSSKLRKKGEIRNVTVEELKKAMEILSSYKENIRTEYIKLPLILVREDPEVEEVRFGPIKVVSTEDFDEISISPFIHIVEERKVKKGKAFVASVNKQEVVVKFEMGKIHASWNGSRLLTDGKSYTLLRRGSSYAKDKLGSLSLHSPSYSLRISKDTVSLKLFDIKLVVTPSMLILESNKRVQRIKDETLSKKFISSLLNLAKSQVTDLLRGIEPSLDEIYNEVDSLLGEIGEKK